MQTPWWSDGLTSEAQYQRRLIARLSEQLRRATGLEHRRRLGRSIEKAKTRLAALILSNP